MRGRTNVSGQGVILNATTANCIVEDGNTIVAGDFVQTSYHPSLEENIIGSNLSGLYKRLVELDDGNILVTYTPSSTTSSVSKVLYWEIYRKSDLVRISSGDFNSEVSSTILINPQLINCGNNKIALVAVSSGNSYNACVIMMTYNPSTNLLSYEWISVGSKAGTTNYLVEPILFDSDTLLVWVSTYLLIFTISTKTWVEKSLGISSFYVGSINRLYAITSCPHIYKYADNKIIVFNAGGIAKTFSVINETVTELGSATEAVSNYAVGFGKINNKLYYEYPSETSNSTGWTDKKYVRMQINDDDTITASAQTSSETNTSCNRHSFQINDNFAVLVKVATRLVYISIMDKNNNSLLPDFEQIYTLPSATEYTVRSVYMQWIDSDKFRIFIQYTNDLICALNCVVAENEISVAPTVTYVKQYATRCNGVAKQNGSAGDTIQVYIPQANS